MYFVSLINKHIDFYLETYLCRENAARNSAVLLFFFSVTSEVWKMNPTYQESGSVVQYAL